MEERSQLAPIVGADVGRESGQRFVGELRRLIELTLRQSADWRAASAS